MFRPFRGSIRFSHNLIRMIWYSFYLMQNSHKAVRFTVRIKFMEKDDLF